MLALVVSVGNYHVLAIFLCEIFMRMLYAHDSLVLEDNGSWLAKKRFWHHAFESVIVVNDKVAFVIVVCLLHLPYLLLQSLHRI